MLWTILAVLLILWLLGLVTSYTLGGFIHLLLVIALILLVIQLVTGQADLGVRHLREEGAKSGRRVSFSNTQG